MKIERKLNKNCKNRLNAEKSENLKFFFLLETYTYKYIMNK